MSDFAFGRKNPEKWTAFFERVKETFLSFGTFMLSSVSKISLKTFGKAGKRGRFWAIKWFAIVFALIFTIEAIVYLVLIPSLQKPILIFSGSRSYSEAELTRVISPLLEKSWMKFSTEEAGLLLSSVSGIEDVQIVKRFPDKVYVNVLERTGVAMTFVSVSDRTLPVQIDRNGVLFTAKSVKSRSIPLVSGIPVENVQGNLRIPAKYRGLLERISAISELSQNYFAAISEIHVVPKDAGNYELLLYPIHGRTRILTGRELSEEALQYMMIALDVVNTIEPEVAEIDLRYGSISYRTRR